MSKQQRDKKRDEHNNNDDDDYTPEEIELLNSIARSEGLHNHRLLSRTVYTPLLHHPLPVSDRRYQHENILRRVMSCKPSFQGMAAISQGDAWTLEEVYMLGGPVTLSPKNGNYPIHLAVQMKNIDCVMVLINIGVDLNVVNGLGYTPLYLAHMGGSHEIIKLLTENHALMRVDTNSHVPICKNGLDVYPEPTDRSDILPGKKMVQDDDALAEYLGTAPSRFLF